MGDSGTVFLFAKIKEIFDQIKSYFNLFGKFYIQFQILCRVQNIFQNSIVQMAAWTNPSIVLETNKRKLIFLKTILKIICLLVVSVFLDDLFEGADLECDTEQPGCQQNCINRFAIVNHKKVWELEMFVIMFTTTLFTAFQYMNDKMQQRYEKKAADARKTFRFKSQGGVVKSGITSMGYISMLVVRFVFETGFLFIENQLSKHQSQKIGFWESFTLKENWICPTNSPKPAAMSSLDELLQGEVEKRRFSERLLFMH